MDRCVHPAWAGNAGSVPLVAVAHGSRDPRSAATMRSLVREIARARPGMDVRLAFLDLVEPSVPEVFAQLAREGHREAVVVPLLLGSAFHAQVDLPALLDDVRLRGFTAVQAPVLGSDYRLVSALRDRLARVGATGDNGDIGVVVAAVGSSRELANSRTRRLACTLASGTSWSGAITCFATATQPDVGTAITMLRRSGARRIAIAPWFLAPGLLTDRVAEQALRLEPGVLLAEPLGAHSGVVDVVLDRYDAAAHAAAA